MTKLRMAMMMPISARKSQSSPIFAKVYFHITEQQAVCIVTGCQGQGVIEFLGIVEHC